MLQFTSLNSGSNGNCYYVGNATEAVLIDAGLSCKETERRMQQVGLNIKLVKAIFVSHEHIDHVRGLAGLADKYNLPVYVTPLTQKGCYHLNGTHAKSFTKDIPITIGDLSIVAFTKNHDAADPHSFIIESKGITVGVFTDIGVVCKNLIAHFKLCNAAFLEANYDVQMLANGRYPTFLKQRISGGKGHLSNDEALQIFKNCHSKKLSFLILGHLSKDNNCPTLVKNLFELEALPCKILVASRNEAMPLLTLQQNKNSIKTLLNNKNKCKQLAMF